MDAALAALVGVLGVIALPILLALFSGSLTYILVVAVLTFGSGAFAVMAVGLPAVALLSGLLWLIALVVSLIGVLGRKRRRRIVLENERLELENREIRRRTEPRL